MRRFILLIGLFIAACGDVLGPTVLIDKAFTLAPGEIAHIANSHTSIAFDGVEGDSRCPADAICISAGDARVAIRAIDDERATAYELHTSDLTPIVHNDLTVRLVELAPYPFLSRPIQPADYRATFKVTRD